MYSVYFFRATPISVLWQYEDSASDKKIWAVGLRVCVLRSISIYVYKFMNEFVQGLGVSPHGF